MFFEVKTIILFILCFICIASNDNTRKGTLTKAVNFVLGEYEKRAFGFDGIGPQSGSGVVSNDNLDILVASLDVLLINNMTAL